MSSYKQFVDTVFYRIEINELIERRKCRATGKVRFNSIAESTFFIHWLKWRVNGRRNLRCGSTGIRDLERKVQLQDMYTSVSFVKDTTSQKSIHMIIKIKIK